MSQICVIKNALDQTEHEYVQTENVLKTFLELKAQHPQARIYTGNPCPENDITPTQHDKASIARLLETDLDYTIVCYPGDVISAVNYVVAKVFGEAVKAFVKIPKPHVDKGTSTGSSNNSLSNPENRQRIKERVPYIMGRVKAIPDLIAPALRYFKEGIEVEELLMCLCENPVQVSKFKEGDTPVAEIPGKSVTVYDLNQSIVGNDNIFKIGDTFSDAPVVAKQNSSVNGQTLLPPNSTRFERSDVYFVYPNQIKTLNATSDFEKFVVNETVTIEGANYGIADLAITGSVNIDYLTQTLTVSSTQTVVSYQDFRKINITAMLITDPVNGQLDLAGLYDVDTITYSSGVYAIKLLNATNTNTNFANLTADASTNLSANLTANTANIFLDGTYTITGIDAAKKLMTLATPSTTNADWEKLAELAGQQTPTALVKLRGNQENYVGWFTIDSPQAKGLLLNFRAGNGIYQGSAAKMVTVEAEYQQVVNNEPVGQVYKQSITLTGRANNRDAVGASMWIDLPFSGTVRFRARRTNDNGDAADLMDETKFYQAYAYHYLEKLTYPNRVIVRARTVATANATSQDSRQLNCIAESLVYSYRDGVKSAERIASRNIAELTIDLALHPKIGRRLESEIDFDRIYQVVDDLQAYFGSERMTEFNYTLDSTNTSFEEIMRMMSAVTCTHDRRVNRKIYYELESAENEPLILFNHRNKQAKSEVRSYNFRVDNRHDGVELSYVDSDDGWVEKTLKIPHDAINNAKKIDGTGIVYREQAHIVAWRAWNKLQFSRVTASFTAYCESDLVFRGDCILNTDDTRLGNCTSGEILNWNNLSIKVSQPFQLLVDQQYIIHLQLKSGAIDVMKIAQGEDEYHFVLERPPIESLVTTGQVKTVYSVTTDDRQNEQKFLVSSKRPIDVFENEVNAINFDDRYYRNDKDIINNLI